MWSHSRRVALFAGMLLIASPLVAQTHSPAVQKSIDIVRTYLQKKGDKGDGNFSHRSSPGVGKTLPNHHFIVVRYRIFPVARVLPEGMHPSNLFAVSKDGKLEHLKDAKTLEAFFRAHSPAVKSEPDAKAMLAAWLTLAQEFHQDGMYLFEVMDKEFTVDGDKANGRAIVMKGGNGQISAELVIDKDGKLAQATEKAALRPGPRPICQATKLLDADPLVRRIAEQDLLIMGLSARDYIQEQRQLAPPALREAIDRVWQQIVKNDW